MQNDPSGRVRSGKFPHKAKAAFLPLTLAAALLGLTGCGSVSTPLTTVSSAGLAGKVHGGQQPVIGAVVSLIAPGTSGYGSAGSVIATAVTNSGGGFTLPRPYTCPANSGLVYLLATGGNAGAGVNSAIALSAVAGNCSSLAATDFFNISEVTTVASAYVLAPFAAAGATSSIGTSATNLQGLYNAIGPYSSLASNSSGFAHVTADLNGIVPPTTEINTLADAIASCINQGTSSPLTGTCSALFTATTPSGGVAPADTFQAALNIAKAPGRNVSQIYNLSFAAPPFLPNLTAVPNDFSVALGFNGGAISSSGTVSVAIDAAGDAWFTTGSGSTSGPTHVLTEIAPSGVYLSGATVAPTTGFDSALLSAPVGIAIDQAGTVYVDNNGGNNLLRFNADASLKSTFIANSFSGPNAVAIDAAGNPWVANFGSAQVTKNIAATGVEASNSPFAAGLGGVDLAIGPNAIWQTNYKSKYLYRIDATSFAVNSIQIGGSIGGIGLDHSNNAWIAVTGNGSVFEITDALGYANTPNGGYMVSGASAQDIAVDGLGNVFAGAVTSTSSRGTLLEYSNSATLLSPGSGFTGSGVIPVVPGVPDGMAVDGSGNIWVAGQSSAYGSLSNYVAEIIGIAAPVVTPRAVATTNNTLGTRP